MKKAHGRLLALEIKDYDDFAKRYGTVDSPERSPIWIDIDRIGWFINGMGFLVYEKFVNIKLVDDLWGYGVVFFWEKLKPLVEGWRKQLNVPQFERWFEYLANELKKREQRQ